MYQISWQIMFCAGLHPYPGSVRDVSWLISACGVCTCSNQAPLRLIIGEQRVKHPAWRWWSCKISNDELNLVIQLRWFLHRCPHSLHPPSSWPIEARWVWLLNCLRSGLWGYWSNKRERERGGLMCLGGELPCPQKRHVFVEAGRISWFHCSEIGCDAGGRWPVFSGIRLGRRWGGRDAAQIARDVWIHLPIHDYLQQYIVSIVIQIMLRTVTSDNVDLCFFIFFTLNSNWFQWSP